MPPLRARTLPQHMTAPDQTLIEAATAELAKKKKPAVKRVKGYRRGPPPKGARLPIVHSTQRALTDKVKTMVDAMVWQGLLMTEAAATAGLSSSAASQALMKPVVKQYMKEQVEVFRTGARLSNFSTVLGIRNDLGQPGKTRIEAARYLDGTEDRKGTNIQIGINVTPGYTVIGGGDEAQQILRLAGSSRNVLDYQVVDTSRSDMAASERAGKRQSGED